MQQEVAVHMAALILQEQYDHVINAYHNHVLELQGLYFEHHQMRWTEFDLSCTLGAPLVALGSEQQNTIEAKMARLLETFQSSCDEELAKWRQSSEEARTELAVVVAKADAQAKAELQSQQDEFFATNTLCRREVASTVALLKSEFAAAHAQTGGLEGLQRAMEIQTKELEMVRTRYDTVTQEQAETIAKLRQELQDVKEKSRATLGTERDEIADQMRAVLARADAERTRHTKEMTDLHSQHASAVEQLRSQLESRTNDLVLCREECDQLRQKELDNQKVVLLEKIDFQRRISDLECEAEKLKAALVSQSQEAMLDHESLEFSINMRKSQELEDFKRRLVSGGGSGNGFSAASRNGNYRSSTSVGSGSFAADSIARATSPNARSPRAPSVLDPALVSAPSPVSPRAQAAAAAASVPPPYRASSTLTTPRGNSVREGSPSVIGSLRSPSETYLRLQNISSSWKDRLGSS